MSPLQADISHITLVPVAAPNESLPHYTLEPSPSEFGWSQRIDVINYIDHVLLWTL